MIGQTDIETDESVNNRHIQDLYTPPVTKYVELISGSLGESSAKLAEIIKEKRLI